MPSRLAETGNEAAEAGAETAGLPAKAEWEGRLQNALGDDAELLALAKNAPLLEIKEAAILALTSEAALKSAEREFRTHDRRIHRLAKQRYESVHAQREVCERANQLIEIASELLKESVIPANRIVELEREWRALDAGLLEEPQIARFADVQASITMLLRERGDRQRANQRWEKSASQALADLNTACSEACSGSKDWEGISAALDAAGRNAETMLSGKPASESSASEIDAAALLEKNLQDSMQKAGQIAGRMGILAELHRSTQTHADTPVDISQFTQRWQALPAIADARINGAMNARFEEAIRTISDARKAHLAEKQQRASEKSRTAQKARIASLEAMLEKAEIALAAGHLAETGQHLAAIQNSLKSGAGQGSLTARIHGLQAEYARLKGWQHWGGGRVRDDLVLEAEALAGNVSGEGSEYTGDATLKQHADSIGKLRARWKELDRMGGATSKELWMRFDAALKRAHLPVAAHQEKLRALRQDNLAARNTLIAALDETSLPDVEQSEAANWRIVARALDHFHADWRKLGPIEHTVPNKERDALVSRMAASVARLELPLQHMRQHAEMARKELILRAKSLSDEAQSRDLVARVRALQSEWQQLARMQPLARRVENAYWAEFKASVDGIFSQRKAMFGARDAELKANQAARELLIARLRELPQDTPGPDIKRIMAEVETAWRTAGEVPRGESARLNEEFRRACHDALRLVASSGQRAWHKTCDTLLAKLSLCNEAESGTHKESSAGELHARWAALPVLPLLWEQALHARFKSAVDHAPPGASAALSADEMNAVFLQLESALEVATPAEFLDARRALSLRLMKSALEGRQPAAAGAGIEKLVTEALGHVRPDPVQQQRLAAIIAALRSGKFEVKGDKVIRLPGR